MQRVLGANRKIKQSPVGQKEADSQGTAILVSPRPPIGDYFKFSQRRYRKRLKKFYPDYCKNMEKDKWLKQKIIGLAQAKYIVRKTIRKGFLFSLSKNNIKCSDCNNRATQYDHRDYNKPLEVEPVCNRCNKKRGKAIPFGRAGV